jgi:hypothetical protein
MSFWNTSEDEDLSQSSTGEFDGGGGSMDPIPEGSKVLAMPKEAKWDEYEGTEFITIQWQVAKPAEYLNRVIFHKLYVTDDDPKAKDPIKKRDKAKRMLAAIDKNAGGKLAKKAARPSDVDLMSALVGKAMLLKLGVWEMAGQDGTPKAGNWVISVAPKGSDEVAVAATKPKPSQAAASNSRASVADDDFDSVPF